MPDSRKVIAIAIGVGLATGAAVMFWSLHRALSHIHTFA